MYEHHFGLKKKFHRATVAGPDVFVGPQSASVMAALKKALAGDDAVIAVTGPVGVGKTTVTRRAIEGVGENRIIVTIGRLKLGHDEVIELLLAGLGAKQLPRGTIQRFAMFRRMLQQYGAQGTRVFIVVEDAARLGADALSELEALTAEDAGASTGASLVLMASTPVGQLLRDPLLARLKQRVKLRQTIEPLSAPEMLAYLKHRFRLAGGEFDAIFEQGTAAVLHRFSDGIPRVANTIVEQALTSAADKQLRKISVRDVETTAAEEIGLTAEHSVAEIREALAEAKAAEPAREPESPVIVETSGSGRMAALQPPKDIHEEPEKDTHESVNTPPKDTHEQPGAQDSKKDIHKSSTAEPKTKKDIHESPTEAKKDTHKTEPDKSSLAAAAQDENPKKDIHESPTAEPKKDSHKTEPDKSALAAAAQDDEDDIPELIQDTLPDLAILAPDLARDADADEAPEAFGVDANDDDDNVPTLSDSMRLDAPTPSPTPDPQPKPAATVATPQAAAAPAPQAEPEPAPAAAQPRYPLDPSNDRPSEDIPAWDRDPTFAELRPDLEALERAMAVAHGTDAVETDTPEPPPAPKAPPEPEIVPEITLDRQIQAKIDEATEALKQTHFDIDADLEDAEPEPDQQDQSAEAATTFDDTIKPEPVKAPGPPAAAKPKPAVAVANSSDSPAPSKRTGSTRDTAELKEIAAGLARARTIEDVDDKLAETLFGEEFSMIAAQVAANAPNGLFADDDSGTEELSLEKEPPAKAPTETAATAPAASPSRTPKPAPDAARLDSKLNETASHRLATVRALNKGAVPKGAPLDPEDGESIVMSTGSDDDAAHGAHDQPESIEEQINTSITQTLKALKIDAAAMNTDKGDDDDRKAGFLSRFRRS